jgi:hypothetical protein
MRRLLLVGTAVAVLLPKDTYAMNTEAALRLLQWWGRDARDVRFLSGFRVDERGGFVARSSGAYFRYRPESGELLVSGLVGWRLKSLAIFPDQWDNLLRAGRREEITLGEGTFELLTEPLFDKEPQIVLLTKSFKDRNITPVQFSREVRWLLMAADHWFVRRYNDVTERPESELIEQASGLVASWPKRPW